MTMPAMVRWSGVIPVRRNAAPTGFTAFSTGARKRPSNIGLQASDRPLQAGRTRATVPFNTVTAPPRRRRPTHLGVVVKTYTTAQIRNVVLLGHGGAGKTTLAEALLARSGAVARAGSVDDGTSVLDTEP